MIIDRKDLGKHFDAGQPSEKKTGTITTLKQDFGFISVPGEKKDIFFHFSNLADPGKKHLLHEGAKVSFQIVPGKGGKPAAINVEILKAPRKKPVEKKNLFGKGKTDDYYLPKDTKNVIKSLLASQDIENFSLLLNKCALYDRNQAKFILSRKEDQKKKISAYQIQPDFGPVPLSDITTRHKEAITSLDLELAKIPPFKVDWRLIVGLGNESIYETSMTLHHIYGIPYIPGQAVKGVVRSWILMEKFEECEDREKMALQKSPIFCDLFGCPKESVYKEARQGKVFFFDAFPTDLSNDSIQPDIMNPHYGDYYSKGKPPADYHEPKPVTFLTVKDTPFQFYLGIKREENKPSKDGFFTEGKSLLERTKEYLIEALTEHGVGAKTAVGYGYFTQEK